MASSSAWWLQQFLRCCAGWRICVKYVVIYTRIEQNVRCCMHTGGPGPRMESWAFAMDDDGLKVTHHLQHVCCVGCRFLYVTPNNLRQKIRIVRTELYTVQYIYDAPSQPYLLSAPSCNIVFSLKVQSTAAFLRTAACCSFCVF